AQNECGGAECRATTKAPAGDDKAVDVFTNLDGVQDREVSASQIVSTIVVQESLREGFGLVVAEALWKGIPVIGGNVGGIVVQIEDGVSGFLVSSVEETAKRAVQLLKDAGMRRRMADAGRERVRDRFLITRDLRDQLQL